MINFYLLAFFRIIIGLVFAISLPGKLRNIPSFIRAITNFRFFSLSFSKPLAYLLLLGEFGTITAMVIGGPVLFWGFLAAALMFLAFSIALSSVVARKVKTSCNCFGRDQENVGFGHIIRSSGFFFCGLSGLFISKMYNVTTASPGYPEIFFIAGISVVFVLVWIHISDIIKLFSHNFT